MISRKGRAPDPVSPKDELLLTAVLPKILSFVDPERERLRMQEAQAALSVIPDTVRPESHALALRGPVIGLEYKSPLDAAVLAFLKWRASSVQAGRFAADPALKEIILLIDVSLIERYRQKMEGGLVRTAPAVFIDSSLGPCLISPDEEDAAVKRIHELIELGEALNRLAHDDVQH
jgi:hypothetical protein